MGDIFWGLSCNCRLWGKELSLEVVKFVLSRYLRDPDKYKYLNTAQPESARHDIRAILNIPDEYITQLFTDPFKIPGLLDSWKDSPANPSRPATELVSALLPSGSQGHSSRPMQLSNMQSATT